MYFPLILKLAVIAVVALILFDWACDDGEQEKKQNQVYEAGPPPCKARCVCKYYFSGMAGKWMLSVITCQGPEEEL